jgi:PAS domain S-box-containing protein
MLTTKAAYAGFVLVVALILANAGVSYWHTRHLVENQDWVIQTRQVLETLNELRATFASAQSSQRGFLITGGRQYLQSYERSVGATRDAIDQLDQLTADDARQRARVNDLETPLRERLDHMQQTVDVRRARGFAAAQAIVATDDGQRLSTQIDNRIEILKDAEKASLATRIADSDRSLRTKIFTNVAGSVLGIAVASFALLLFLRTLQRRQSAEVDARAEARRQAVIAELRRLALSDDDVDTLMQRAAELTAESLAVPLVGIFELLPSGEALRLRAGVGWADGTVGSATLGAGLQSPAGFVLETSRPEVEADEATYRPVFVEDIGERERFGDCAVLAEHGAVSSLGAVIHDGGSKPFGVLEAYGTTARAFTGEEAALLRSIANLLATALQRHRNERALRESEARFRGLAESLPEIIWTSLPDGRCEYLNERWHELTGIPCDDAREFGWASALHEEDAERIEAEWMESMRSGEPFESEFRLRRRDGSYCWCIGRAVALRDTDGRITRWFGNCTDIDKHLRMEKTLQQTDRRKNEFLAVLAHELRNPLAPIGVVAQLLKLPKVKPEQIKQSAKMIDDQVGHMTRLIEDLSDASRIGQGKVRIRKERVDVQTLVERALALARQAIDNREHRLVVDLGRQPLTVDADPTRIAQVLANLLINASKYTEPGGRIELSASREHGTVTIRVKDSGMGIPADMLDSVFNDFFQIEGATSHSQGGLGIGLGLVRRLVELHGGTVHVISEGQGQGSEFVVQLPAPASDTPAQFRRVLVADDHSIVAQSFARLLDASGCEVTVAHSGPETIELAQRFRPDLVFLDIGLPGLDGCEVARRLRENPAFNRTMLVALSGYGDEKRSRALQAGFDRYIVKPLRPETLREILTAAPERAPDGKAGRHESRDVGAA